MIIAHLTTRAIPPFSTGTGITPKLLLPYRVLSLQIWHTLGLTVFQSIGASNFGANFGLPLLTSHPHAGPPGQFEATSPDLTLNGGFVPKWP